MGVTDDDRFPRQKLSCPPSRTDLPPASRLLKEVLSAPLLCVQPVSDVEAGIGATQRHHYRLAPAPASMSQSVATFFDRVMPILVRRPS